MNVYKVSIFSLQFWFSNHFEIKNGQSRHFASDHIFSIKNLILQNCLLLFALFIFLEPDDKQIHYANEKKDAEYLKVILQVFVEINTNGNIKRTYAHFQ